METLKVQSETMSKTQRKIRIISGSTHQSLAGKIATDLGLPGVTKADFRQQSDSEIFFEIKESIRDKHIFIIQSKSSNINENIMELLIMIHTCKLASSRKISAVITYFPYSRQDKKMRSRSPITAKLFANLLERAGADHIITMDLHSPQIQGFFNIPVDNLFAEMSIMNYIKDKIKDWQKAVIVSPDAGGTKRVVSIATKMSLDFAIIHKQRNGSSSVKSMILVGDVSKRTAIIIDDIVDTSSTIIMATQKLRENNVSKIYAIATHGILSGQALKQLNESALEKIAVTNTISQESNESQSSKLSVIDVSSVFAQAISCCYDGVSLSQLFVND